MSSNFVLRKVLGKVFRSFSVLCELENSPHLSHISMHALAVTHNLVHKDVNIDIS